ncbi:APC family permease [Robiginitalea aurantiaca]|uniref:Amino acid permease n=1 Tax=Robiginitalea aurantiaca TaxID=3056915 RepID=A0ABT7WEA8_9FLAO|nr:amino acid permease [Robiginitalea aurantiaca]MDM9631164.1 amino acid permease [Robiginitalea aurantiaca]
MTKKIGWKVAAALVVANMIGTGVFTSLGFQLLDVQNTWSIGALWVLGGVMALVGAFCYAEVGSAYARSGGEYVFLTKLYHPFVGYLAGWVSLIVGFAAPTALAAMALGAYLDNVVSISPTAMATGIVVLISVIHSFNIEVSSRFQAFATWFKVLLLVFLIMAGLFVTSEVSALDFSVSWTGEILTPTFAIAFVYVSYSYTGWNAAAYILDEIEQPRQNLPKALVRGTLVVTLLYVSLQMVFLKHGSLDALQGQIDVGHVFATEVFGARGASGINFLIAFFLISSISAMIWVGPRVSMAMSEDYDLWRFLKRKNRNGIPVVAIWFQGIISIFYIMTGTFESVLLYCGFILQLSSALAVGGVFILRKRNPSATYYQSPFFPWLPLLFLMFSVWILGYLIVNQPRESLMGLAILSVGAITYLLSPKTEKA